MSTFTITLREAIEATGGTSEYVDGRTRLVGSNIGLEYYPIFNESYRDMLNSLIVDHYWNEEIAHETVAVFRQRLSSHMFLHMPTFNKRYNLALTEFDPLVTMQILNKGKATSVQTATSEAASSGVSNARAGSRNVFSDTPGAMLAGNADYATNASDATQFTDSDSNSDDSSHTESESGGETESSTTGYNGAPADILMRAQQAIVNIDLMVIDSLQPLFFGLWSNSDEFTAKDKYYD